MANICFTWELGQGYGHLVRYRALIERLLERGHRVSFIVKDEARARRVFDDLDISVLPIRPGATPPGERLVQLNSYPEILHDFGFNAPARLRHQLQPWLDYLAAGRPDLLVIDHSPTALVAARVCRIPAISSGTGFTVPPRETPMRAMRYWSVRGREHLAEHERLVLDTCNAVLRDHGARELASMAELLETDREWLLSFAELDHYGDREGGRYLGSFPAASFGAEPRWRPVAGPKLFAYLSVPDLTDAFCGALRDTGANLCLHAPQLRDGATAALDPDRLVVAAEPVDVRAVAAAAAGVITNGGLNSVSTFLAAGVPQLALPNNLERHMVSRRLELVGGGLMAPWRDARRLGEKLRAVIADRAYARAAENFAARYATASAAQQTESMIADVEELLSA